MQPPPEGGGEPAGEGAGENQAQSGCSPRPRPRENALGGAGGQGWGPLALGRFAPFVRGSEPAGIFIHADVVGAWGLLTEGMTGGTRAR